MALLPEPATYDTRAREIATSWRQGGGNYVLVAPPLTEADYIFKLLSDISFHESCDLEPDKLKIASLSPTTYATTDEFERRVHEKWEIEFPSDSDQSGNLDELDNALESIVERNQIPVILLPQFHKAVEKLTWNLGQRLRDLEVHYGLCTVVGLPVPLSSLRSRWELIANKDVFLGSDFGQGHSLITLTGYQRQEIEDIVHTLEINGEYAEVIQKWSGGLPALVRWLIRDAGAAKSGIDLERSARAGSPEQCRRFLKWLDAPDADDVKRAVSKVWRKDVADDAITTLRNHAWKDVLIDKNACIPSNAIGHSCMQSFGVDSSEYLSLIANAVEQRGLERIDALVNALPDTCRQENRTRLILELIPVCKSTIGLSPDWGSIEKAVKGAKKRIGKVKDESADMVAVALAKWERFAKEIGRFNRQTDRNAAKDWRLSDSLSGRENDGALAAVQLVLYRLNEAHRLPDSNAALKSMLEIPEQILQIYCGRKLDTSVWKAEYSNDEIEMINKLWKGKKRYLPPRKGSRFRFTDLLFLGWVRMKKLDKDERLFHQEEELDYWRENYGSLRNQPSHSITFESDERSNEFYRTCVDLTDRLARSLTGETSDALLPNLEAIIASLAKPAGHVSET